MLVDVNAAGTRYSSIWDAGGVDQIVYEGARDANIDLRPATLQYEQGGGGWVSYAFGIHGGFTIANGVTVENARSGSGNDALIGNDAANRLESGAGTDVLSGNGGNDVLIGGAGRDTLTGGAGADSFVYQSNADSAVGIGRDVITDFTRGSDLIDVTALNASSFVGTALFSGQAGQLRYASFDGTTIIELDSNGDRIADFQIELGGMHTLGFSDFLGLESDATAIAPVRGGGGGGGGGGQGGGKKLTGLDSKSSMESQGGSFALDDMQLASLHQPSPMADYFL